MLVIGKPDYAPVLAVPEAVAAESGFREGDRLLSVDGRDTPTWTEATQALLTPLIDRRAVEVAVREADGDAATRTLALDQVPAGLDELQGFAAIGLRGRAPVPPPVVADVVRGSPADGVLRAGDRILRVNGAAIADFAGLGAPLRDAPTDSPPPRLALSVQRGGDTFDTVLEPALAETPAGSVWRIGVQAADSRDALLRYGPLEALPQAFMTTGRLAADTVGVLARMLTGAASLQNLSGPITIAQAANTTAKRGVAWFLYFLAMLSVSIAILNLLPIPVLDGGHLLYYLIELVRGRPLGERVRVAGQYVGLALLASLMGLALFNDVLRLVP